MSTPTPTQRPVAVEPTESGGTAARPWLRAGALAAPLLLLVWLAQALVRPGYDLSRHPMSLLALGEGGWVQAASFVATGALVLALAMGYRALEMAGRGRRAIPVLLAAVGVGLVIAGVFPTDAGAGFPAGAPDGRPEMSTTGLLHEVGFLLAMLGSLAALVVVALRARQRHDRALLGGTVAVLVVTLALAAAPHATTFPVRTAVAGVLPIAFLALGARRVAGR